MLKFPEEVTSENFPQAWKYTVSKMRSAKKTAFLRKLSSRTARFVYFLSFCAGTFGAIRSMPLVFMDGFLSKVPKICAVWDRFAAPYFPAGISGGAMILRYAAILYGLPLAAVLTVTLLGTFFYHPLPAKMPDNQLNQARELWNHARCTEVMNRRDDVAGVGFWAVIYSIALVLAAALFLVSAAKGNDAAEPGVSITALAIRVVLGCAAAIVCYAILYIPLRAVIRLLFRTSTPKGFSAQCETYYRRVQLQPVSAAATANPVAAEPAKSDTESTSE